MRWTVKIPIQVYDENDNFAPIGAETRVDEIRRHLEVDVYASSAQMAAFYVSETIRDHVNRRLR